MSHILIQPTQTAHWFALINEAESSCSVRLHEELESYLVFLLMRFSEKPEIAISIVATELMQSLQLVGHLQSDRLRNVGDTCLLFAGLFPGLAKKRGVKENYYIQMGKNAYYILGDLCPSSSAGLFYALGQQFHSLQKILLSLRPQVKELDFENKINIHDFLVMSKIHH